MGEDQKHLRILLWTLVWVVVLLIGAEVGLRNWSIYLPQSWEPYMLRWERDVWVHNAFGISKIKSLYSPSNMDTFIFLGGSAVVEAITSDEMVIGEVKRKSGKDINFVSLASNWGAETDYAKILTKIGPIDATVFIGIRPDFFQAEVDVQLQTNWNGKIYTKYCYIPIPDSVLDILHDHVGEVPMENKYVLPRTAELIGEAVKIRIKDEKIKLDFYPHHRERDKTHKYLFNAEETRKVFSIWPRHSEFFDVKLALLKEVVKIAKQNGMRVILVDLAYPLSTRCFVEDVSQYYYDEVIKGLIQDYSVEYYPVGSLHDWPDSLFRDNVHLNIDGRRIFTSVLSAYIGNLQPK